MIRWARHFRSAAAACAEVGAAATAELLTRAAAALRAREDDGGEVPLDKIPAGAIPTAGGAVGIGEEARAMLATPPPAREQEREEGPLEGSAEWRRRRAGM